MLLNCPLCKSNLMLTIDETIPPTDVTLGLKCFCGLDVRAINGDPCTIIDDIKNILEAR